MWWVFESLQGIAENISSQELAPPLPWDSPFKKPHSEFVMMSQWKSIVLIIMSCFCSNITMVTTLLNFLFLPTKLVSKIILVQIETDINIIFYLKMFDKWYTMSGIKQLLLKQFSFPSGSSFGSSFLTASIWTFKGVIIIYRGDNDLGKYISFTLHQTCPLHTHKHFNLSICTWCSKTFW